MYSKFSDRARKVMALANQEAQRFNHKHVGTEHILLGIVKEGDGLACTIMTHCGIDPHKVRLEIEKVISSEPDMVTMGKLPLTPRAKQVIEYANKESQSFKHPHVSTEHLLLGLTMTDGVAREVLKVFGLNIEKAREVLLVHLKEPNQGNKCLIGYKTGTVNGRVYGHRILKLEECCQTFKTKFMESGNNKSRDFNLIDTNYNQGGLNFGTIHGELSVFLFNEPVRFCPFCGAKVEIKELKVVALQRTMKQVPGDLVEVE